MKKMGRTSSHDSTKKKRNVAKKLEKRERKMMWRKRMKKNLKIIKKEEIKGLS